MDQFSLTSLDFRLLQKFENCDFVSIIISCIFYLQKSRCYLTVTTDCGRALFIGEKVDIINWDQKYMRVPMRTLIVTIVSHSGRTIVFIEFTFLEIYENFSTNSFWKTPMINAEARQKHVFHQTLEKRTN